VAKPNYNFARKQKEITRKARQQEKRKDKAVRTADPVEIAAVAVPGELVAAGAVPASGSGA